MSESESWKLQDAKARFSEVVRRARTGKPQQITVHGKAAVLVVDIERFEVRPKPQRPRTLAGFVEASKKYRGTPLQLRRFKMDLPSSYRSPFDEDDR